MLGDRGATSEQSSSVREGVGYDEVYPSGCEPVEDWTQSPERESSAHSSIDEEEEEYKGNKEEGEEEDEEEEDGEGEGEEECNDY